MLDSAANDRAVNVHQKRKRELTLSVSTRRAGTRDQRPRQTAGSSREGTTGVGRFINNRTAVGADYRSSADLAGQPRGVCSVFNRRVRRACDMGDRSAVITEWFQSLAAGAASGIVRRPLRRRYGSCSPRLVGREWKH